MSVKFQNIITKIELKNTSGLIPAGTKLYVKELGVSNDNKQCTNNIILKGYKCEHCGITPAINLQKLNKPLFYLKNDEGIIPAGTKMELITRGKTKILTGPECKYCGIKPFIKTNINKEKLYAILTIL